MATYVPKAPAQAVRCGSDALEIEAPNQAVALLIARLGAGDYVNGRVEGFALQEIRRTVSLEREIAAMTQPRVLYTLGESTGGAAGVWRIPYEVFVVDASPKKDVPGAGLLEYYKDEAAKMKKP